MALTQEAVDGLKEFLGATVTIRSQHKSMTDPRWHYVGIEGFVLDEGQAFTEFSPWQPITPSNGKRNRYRPRIPQHCFYNSYCAAVASKGKLRYVEGYAA